MRLAKLKVGVIGLGGISDMHISGLLANEEAVLWSVCDCKEEVLARRGEQYNIPEARRYLNYTEMLADPELEAVSIGTPNYNHFEIACEAIKHQKPFALEKPVTLGAQEAAALRDLVTEAHLPHMICFSYRYKSAVRFAKWLINQGKLGEVKHVYGQYLQGWGLDGQLPLVWRFRKELSGSGVLGDLGSHLLDLQRFLVGNVERVIADADTIIRKRTLLEGDGEGKGEVDVDDFCHVLARLEGAHHPRWPFRDSPSAGATFSSWKSSGTAGRFCITWKKRMSYMLSCPKMATRSSEKWIFPKNFKWIKWPLL